MATLSGTVRDNSGIPVPDATVSAFDQQNSLVSEDTTGSEGATLGTYRLTKVTQGRTYVLRVTIGEATRTVGEVNVNSQSMTHDISLSDGAGSVTSATSATSATTATSDTSSATSATDTSSTTATDTSSTTATDTSSTTSATSDSSTSSSTTDSSTSITSGTSSSSTVSSDTSSSTTMTATSSVSVTLTVTVAPDPEFAALTTLINDPAYAITPPVNIDEARQARNMMTVGFYIRAGVPQAIANLNSTNNGLTLTNRADFGNKYGDAMKTILDRRNEPTQGYTENDALVKMRQLFNQGLESADNINRDFPATYRGLVNLIADDLMGVTPQQLDNTVVFDATQRERLFNFLRRLKSSIISLTESLSFAGDLDPVSIGLVSKWSKILRDSLSIIQTVGQTYVATDNVDEKHWATVLSKLVSRPVAENRPYLVHAREGGQLLSDVIQVYEKITQQDGLEKEDESFIRDLFYTSGNVFPGQTVAERLKENGRLLRENWPTNFGA